MAIGQQILRWAAPVLAPALALAFLLANQAQAQDAPGGRGPQGPTPVGVMTVTQEDVPYTVTLPGRAIAYQQTSIRPQVGGIVGSGKTVENCRAMVVIDTVIE